LYRIESEIDKDYAGELSYHLHLPVSNQPVVTLSYMLLKNLYTSIKSAVTCRNFSVGNFK